MTSKNKCRVCGRTFKSQHAVWGHMKAHRGELKVDKAQLSGEGEASSESLDTTPEKVTITGQFYPSLETWKSEPKDDEGDESLDSVIEEPSPSAAPTPGQKTIAAFDTSGLWRAIGDFLDGSILKDKPTKIHMTDLKAKMLNDSLMSMGFMVEAPKEPVVVSYWMPFTITVFSVFLLPVILSVAPDLFKHLPFGKKKEVVPKPLPEKPTETAPEETLKEEPDESIYDRRDKLP